MGYITESKQYQSLVAARKEAERFIKLADEAIEVMKEDDKKDWHKSSYKEIAAAKRASMDLTRSLSVVRKGNSF